MFYSISIIFIDCSLFSSQSLDIRDMFKSQSAKIRNEKSKDKGSKKVCRILLASLAGFLMYARVDVQQYACGARDMHTMTHYNGVF